MTPGPVSLRSHTTDDGCRLAYLDEGPRDAPVLILAHALGTTAAVWDGPAATLARQYRVVRYDARGHGVSAVPAGPWTIERLGRDTLSLLDGLGVRSATVGGVSIGGLSALWVAIHAPDRVDRLILANTAARVGDHALWTDRIRLVEAEGLTPLADSALARWFTAEFRRRAPETVAAFRAALLATPVAGYLGGCEALRDADFRSDTHRVRARTLIIAGRADAATTLADAEWLQQQIAGAEVLALDAAHLAVVECGADVSDRVARWVGQR